MLKAKQSNQEVQKKVVEVKCGCLWIFIILDNVLLVRHESVLPSACWGSASMPWVIVLLFLSLLTKLKHSHTLLRGLGSAGASRGRKYCQETWEKREVSGKAHIGEFIKRQSADSKEFFFYWNLLFVVELPLQNILKHVLGLSRQSCSDTRLCSCSGCVFSKEP